jgi:hypothetical protein
MAASPRVYRWDLDKTYLRTDFDSVRGLMRAAVEAAQNKVNVPGTAALLRELRRGEGGPHRIYFISGSPRQMRTVLEQKLKLDGVEWDGFVLKPNIGNLLRGRFRAIKDQIGYKLPVLLETRALFTPPSPEVMFGDDAEWDAFVYSLYGDLIAGRVERGDLDRTLQLARVYPDARKRIYAALEKIPPYEAVRRVFINLDRRTPPAQLAHYGERVVPIFNYFQAALVLGEQGDLAADAVIRVALEMVNRYGYTVEKLSNSYQEILRRGAIQGEIGLKLEEALKVHHPRPGEPSAEEVLHAFRRRVRAIPPPARHAPAPFKPLDYPSIFVAEQRRHAERKKRKKVERPIF